MRLTIALSALLLTAPLQAAARADSLDAAARDYVRLQLAIGEKEDGYIDAYYGPNQLKADGKALGARSDLPALQHQAEALRGRIAKLGAITSGDNARRARFLGAQLTAAVTRLRMLRGEKLSFDDEAQGLFGVRPEAQAAQPLRPDPREDRQARAWKRPARRPGRCLSGPLHRSQGSPETRDGGRDRRLQGAHGAAYPVAQR